MDPYDQDFRSDFFNACEYHRRRLRKSHELRTKLLRDYAGSHYSERDLVPRNSQPLNLMKQAAEAHMLSLSGGDVRFNVVAIKGALIPFAKHFTTALNNLAKEIHLSETIRELVLDGFFGLAVAKLFLADAPLVKVEEDVWMNPGQPYVGRVSPDDFLFDTDATDFRKVMFSADRYRIPFYILQEDDTRFDPEVVEKLHPVTRRNIASDHEEARSIAFGEETDEGEYEPHIELADVYFPREQLIVTWAVDAQWSFQSTNPLAVLEWDGAETGPYELLNLGPVPDNILPTSPAENMKYMYDMINSAYRKMNNQSRRQKDIIIVPPGSEQDAENMIRARDGEVITVTDPEGIKPVSLGGVNQGNLQFALAAEQVADRLAGNLTAKLGLGPSSETATQDRMINEASGATTRSMQEKVVKFVSNIGKHLAWLLFDDPAKEIPGSIRVGGTNYEYDSTWTPDYREGTFDQYEYRVEPYSLPYKSPGERAQVLDMVVQKLLPMMPMLQEQGIQFDFQKYLEKQAELLDAPGLLELFKVAPPKEQVGGQNGASQSPVTQRETIRRNVSGGEAGGAPQQLLAQMGQQSQGPQIQ